MPNVFYTNLNDEDPRITPVLPYRREDKRPIVDRVICAIGLGGVRERFTIGEAVWWTVSVALISSGLTGAVIVGLIG